MENGSQWDACALKVEKMRKYWANIFTGKAVVKINTVQIALIASVLAVSYTHLTLPTIYSV